MDFEVLVRYAVPGTLLVTPLMVWLAFNPNAFATDSSYLGVLAAGILIPVGYIIHQLWFALFESRGGYVSLKRPNLAFILLDHPDAESTSADVRHAYYAWEDWVYGGSVPNGHLQRARRLWQLYHGLSSSALASMLAIPLALLLHEQVPILTLVLVCISLLLAGTAFAIRAHTIANEVHEWELMMAVEDAGPNGAHLLRQGVARFIQVESQMGHRMRAWQAKKRSHTQASEGMSQSN